MVTDEDDDRALFACNVVQCVSLAVGARKPKLCRRRIESDLGGGRRHLTLLESQIYACTTLAPVVGRRDRHATTIGKPRRPRFAEATSCLARAWLEPVPIARNKRN